MSDEINVWIDERMKIKDNHRGHLRISPVSYHLDLRMRLFRESHIYKKKKEKKKQKRILTLPFGNMVEKMHAEKDKGLYP